MTSIQLDAKVPILNGLSGDHAAAGTPALPLNGHTPNGQDSRPFTLGNFSIDEYKPIKVVCIGAGVSGIIAGIR